MFGAGYWDLKMKVLEWVLESVLSVSRPLFPLIDKDENLKYGYIAGFIAVLLLIVGIIFLVFYVPITMFT